MNFNKDGLSAIGVLDKIGAYYKSVKGPDGKRLSPLVAYEVKDSSGRNYVGEEYVNFGRAEIHGNLLNNFARHLLNRSELSSASGYTGFCAVPMGGILLAGALAQAAFKTVIYPEKKVIIGTGPNRGMELSELIFYRHEPLDGQSFWITVDIFDGSITTANLIRLIETYGARVKGIVCFLNGSKVFNDFFLLGDCRFPIVSVVRPIPMFEQDDPEVSEDVITRNIVWLPKLEWNDLLEAVKCKKLN